MNGAGPGEPECARAAAELVARRFDRWRGLPRGCRPEEVQPRLGRRRPGDGRASLGDGEALFTLCDAEGFAGPVRLWHDAERGVLTIDAPLSQPFHAPGEPVAGLGAPEARLDFPWRTIVMPAGEWVFPERGIALFLDVDGGEVMHVAVFPPTTLDGYLSDHRVHLGERRLPGRRL